MTHSRASVSGSWGVSRVRKVNDHTTDVPSHVYYFSVGAGVWRGSFTFRITSWSVLLRADVGVKNGLLAFAMAVSQKLLGDAQLSSEIIPNPTQGTFGTADNTVKISQLGLTQYLLRERYILDPDGSRVRVEAQERFGPFPGLLTRTFTYPAEIHSGGMTSTYHIPLLGSPWTANYTVSEDRSQLSGELVCSWAKAREAAHRVDDKTSTASEPR
jgi:hypothetical protein